MFASSSSRNTKSLKFTAKTNQVPERVSNLQNSLYSTCATDCALKKTCYDRQFHSMDRLFSHREEGFSPKKTPHKSYAVAYVGESTEAPG